MITTMNDFDDSGDEPMYLNNVDVFISIIPSGITWTVISIEQNATIPGKTYSNLKMWPMTIKRIEGKTSESIGP